MGRRSPSATHHEDVYISAPLTPQDVHGINATSEPLPPATPGKKASLAARYALEKPFCDRENPLENASIFSIISTHWLQPLISLGARKVLEKDDLWRVCHQDTCDSLEIRFANFYDNHQQNQQNQQIAQQNQQNQQIAPKRSSWAISRFAVALLRTFQRDIALVFANYLVYLTAMVLQPFLSMAILDYLNDRVNVFYVSNGYVLVLLMASVSFIGVTCLNYGVFLLSRIGANMRSVVMNAVYQKALRLSSAARQSYTTGEIMTLMSVDTERIFSANLAGPWILVAPLAFVVTIALVAAMFDVIAALCGGALLVVVLATSVRLAKKIGTTQSELLTIVEERVKVTSEALQGIRVMKFYAWEESLATRVETIRAKEVQMYRRFHFLSIGNTALLFLTPVLLGAVILGVYIARKGTLTVTEAFTLIAMVNISRLAVSMFPLAIASLSQARITFQRMDKYMESEELRVLLLPTSHEPLPLPASQQRARDVDGSILVRNATFEWSDTVAVSPSGSNVPVAVTDVPSYVVVDEELAAVAMEPSSPQKKPSGFAMEGINVEIDAGALVMVVGTVGSGKSSLLHALLGEMARTSGRCDVHGRISYVSQEAWIRNASVKENILFESAFDSNRYETVLQATQLSVDLGSLPNGDQTEIGERGINLSGGQKARVAIARAMYRDEYDILMLDDPLSAVDPHVAHAIFDQCIMGLASIKTRVLVLNSHYDLLVHADKILVVENGKVVGDGTYKTIFTQFPSLDIHQQEEEQEQARQATRPTAPNENDLELILDQIQMPTSPSKAPTNQMPTTTTSPIDQQYQQHANKPKKPTATRLVQEEDRVKGRVSGNTYRTYFDETGFNGIVVVLALSLAYGAAQAFRIAADYWQGYWAKQMQLTATYSVSFYAWWYFAFVILCTLLTFARGLFLIEMCMRTARNLHDELFRRVLKAPVNLYFDITPVGRILNRFSNDLDQVDANLPQQYQGLFESLVSFVGCLVVCAFASLYVALAYIPMVGIFIITGLYFKRSSREIKRLEGVTRTPIFNLFGETLHGLSTIRAFQMETQFIVRNKKIVDDNASYYFHFWAAGRWLAVRLDWLSVGIIFVVSLYIVSAKGQISPLVAGLSITYSLMLTSMVQWCVRSLDMTDNAMTSVERLLSFREIPSEPLCESPPESTATAVPWRPTQGAITFHGLCLQYRPELPLVLRGVDMEIQGGEKVGICGRTGAGKSSLMIALFRICEFTSGSVVIDGVDISSLPLKDLRRGLAIIPQDPVLYSGSLRDNLDPFGEFSDHQIWHVLRQVHLANAFSSNSSGDAGLSFQVAERGENLSVGQRQLLCIGRALLKDSQIVVLDEATANVDSATDQLIQQTIQQTFANKTVLIIAHRIHTIVHCHKIAVMDKGQVAEFGAPQQLLQNEKSIFASLAKKSKSPAAAHITQE